MRYRYEHLIELDVALFGLQRGMKPQEVAKILTDRRKYLRTIYKKAFSDQPEAAMSNKPELSVSIENCEYSGADELFEGLITLTNHGAATARQVEFRIQISPIGNLGIERHWTSHHPTEEQNEAPLLVSDVF